MRKLKYLPQCLIHSPGIINVRFPPRPVRQDCSLGSLCQGSANGHILCDIFKFLNCEMVHFYAISLICF